MTNCHQLTLQAADGKQRLTDVADSEQLLRVIQSIPSPKAEPFKLWLPQVGAERIEETIDPEQAIDRALETYQKKGYSDEWIHQRVLSIRIRNNLTGEWQKRGVEKCREYAILTDEITRAWAGMSTRQYKNIKGLAKENLRDNMSDMELVLTMLAEATTTDISKIKKPETFAENQTVFVSSQFPANRDLAFRNKIGVQACLLHKLFVGSLLGDVRILQHNDLVCVAHCF